MSRCKPGAGRRRLDKGLKKERCSEMLPVFALGIRKVNLEENSSGKWVWESPGNV